MWDVLVDVVILLGVGALLGGLLERVKQNAILGYLLAGSVLGPNALNLVQSGEAVLALSELGVALLLFVIGLEFSLSRLRQMGSVAILGGALQVVLTLAAGLGAGVLCGFDVATALAIGATLALSSTACVLRVLTSRGDVESVHGGRTLAVLLVQDIAVVPLVLLLSVLSVGGPLSSAVLSLLQTLGIALGLVVCLYVVFNHLIPRVLGTGPMHHNRDLPLLITVVSGLGAGVAAHAVGISPALGAFLAGMMLAESPYSIQIRADVSSLKTILLTLFFTSIGMLADLTFMAANALLVAVCVVAVIALKASIVFAAFSMLGVRRHSALATGVCLAQMGEFSFVLAGVVRGSLFDEHTFLLIVSVTILTMILSPYLVTFAPRLAALFVRDRSESGPFKQTKVDGEERQAIVIGFGPAGRAASERIADMGVPVTIIDQNPKTATAGVRHGYRVLTGDARHLEVLQHAGLAHAVVVVVTVPVATVALDVVRSVKVAAPEARVLVRARFHRSLAQLEAAGAHVVVDEEHAVGRLIARAAARVLRDRKGEGPHPSL